MKLIALGCGLERLTFVHYIEQALNVLYRFFKEFNASIKLGSTLENLVVRYFVRNLNINTELDFSNLEKEAISKKNDKNIYRPISRTIDYSTKFF